MNKTARDIDRLLDAKGYMAEPEQWNVQLAVRLARRLGIDDLEVAHWQVIERLRHPYLMEGHLPVFSHLCHTLDLDDHCVATLFGGPIEAWKVAGLPDPGEEARVYMEGMEVDDSITPPPGADRRDL
jgi:tRNA 2-thiouridine synthesizing protein E